jgi:RHS repeat-associated protein
MVTNGRGKQHERIEYTPYGEIWVEHKYEAEEGALPYRFTGKELDEETGFYYYGARYLDPRTSRWISGDPAMGDYIPSAPVNEEARKRNGNLPGMGGVYNVINLHTYHYAGNNPLKYTDPDGRTDLGEFTITAYNISHESEFEAVDMVEPNGLDRAYPREFLQDVLMQGTGVDTDGNYITIDWLQGSPTTVDATYFTYTDGVRGASGRLLENGISIAVDPSVIPLDTWVNIEGIGLRRADDTGGAIIGNHIDLFMDVTNAEAMEFGVIYRNVSTQDN